MLELLRKTLRIRRLYSRKGGFAIVIDYCLLLIAITFVISLPKWHVMAVWYVGVVIWLILILRSSVKYFAVKNRVKKLRHTNVNPSAMPSMLSMTAINDELERGSRQKALSAGPGWQLFEMEVDIMRHTKYGDFVGKQLYYTVYEVELSRIVPNILFDSHLAKGRQFKYRYVGSQQLSLEGDFDGLFTVYAPDHYKIDTLSFVTPEVMLAIRDARHFDIELVNNRLFMYGPLLFDESEMQHMQMLGAKLAVAINDNIDTYADSYLKGATRRETTTQFARQLLESPIRSAVGIAVMSALVIAAIVASIHEQDDIFLTNQISFIVYITLIGYIAKLVKILRANKRARAGFEIEQRMQGQTDTLGRRFAFGRWRR
ncbi:hypothetical protein BH09PAT3_BH09PAT3_4220 [soil metagenome]